LLTRWIEQGGEYAKHWSYQKPEAPVKPEVSAKDWPVGNDIDLFIHRRLMSEGLAPAAVADRLTLARRVALDLTGVPPTWAEANAFANDEKPGAYERFVDAQLAKATYGERWAAMWLDLARYADSAGYADDRPRTIWAYRDWVIRALNENKPFDQFTIEQLAGDLLESPTDDQLIATAFHRNTLTNSEGGTNDEEFRTAAVVDRVNTTMEVWMGTTAACAQCHTHKYDPITHAEYFQLYDFFNQSSDNDHRDELPLHEVWTDEQEALKLKLDQQITDLKAQLDRETPELAAERAEWLKFVQQAPSWEPLSFVKATGGQLSATEEGWITRDEPVAEKGVYHIDLATQLGQLQGLLVEISPEQKNNFVLTQLKARWTPKESTPVKGRFVRMMVPGDKKMIHLAEMEVFVEGENIAPKSKASQSSTGFGGNVERAIDGNTDGVYAKNSVSHTNVEKDPWFELDLGGVKGIDQIKLWGRTDQGTVDRHKGYVLQILNAERTVIWEQKPSDVPSPMTEFALTGARAIPIAAAMATFEQNGFPAAAVLNDKVDSAKGWAIAGKVGEPVELTLTLKDPLELEEGVLTVSLSQESKYANHLLTNFRVSASGSANLGAFAKMPQAIRVISQKTERSEKDEQALAKFHRTVAQTLSPVRDSLAKAEKQRSGIKAATTVPIMSEVSEDKHRKSHIQIRGNYKSLGEQVEMATPAVFHPMREEWPMNRLGLAYWLVDSENPLTARVIVNRFWAQIFGQGLVETSEEFGSQGELPTHPELLDYLALDLQSDWDLKRFLKQLVMSSTYQQQSTADAALIEADPFNKFYARGPRFRVSAEMVRDQALFVSGLLSEKMYGKPVNPPQPKLGLKAAFGGATDWETSKGEDKFRRGIYTTWRRSSPYPSMATFDSPNREVCISRRGRTNTPLQALVTLNDPVYVEAAQALGRRA
ncbi:MAG: DUF1553 domain-containing protein, partial [Verrucomicrobiota bacterium]